MLTIFCGFDSREAIGYHVFCASVLHRASIPVSFSPLRIRTSDQGTNQFTVSRFLVPYLMGYKGTAVFADAADMICLADVAELEQQLKDVKNPVGLVKHDYKTRHKIKYVGTDMQSPNVDYERKNWASLMLMDCENPAWKSVTPKSLNTWSMIDLLKFKFLDNSEITEIPDCWNRLVDEGQSIEGAKILHWTAGIPGFKHYADAPGADLWRKELERTCYPLHTP